MLCVNPPVLRTVAYDGVVYSSPRLCPVCNPNPNFRLRTSAWPGRLLKDIWFAKHLDYMDLAPRGGANNGGIVSTGPSSYGNAHTGASVEPNNADKERSGSKDTLKKPSEPLKAVTEETSAGTNSPGEAKVTTTEIDPETEEPIPTGEQPATEETISVGKQPATEGIISAGKQPGTEGTLSAGKQRVTEAPSDAGKQRVTEGSIAAGKRPVTDAPSDAGSGESDTALSFNRDGNPLPGVTPVSERNFAVAKLPKIVVSSPEKARQTSEASILRQQIVPLRLASTQLSLPLRSPRREMLATSSTEAAPTTQGTQSIEQPSEADEPTSNGESSSEKLSAQGPPSEATYEAFRRTYNYIQNLPLLRRHSNLAPMIPQMRLLREPLRNTILTRSGHVFPPDYFFVSPIRDTASTGTPDEDLPRDIGLWSSCKCGWSRDPRFCRCSPSQYW